MNSEPILKTISQTVRANVQKIPTDTFVSLLVEKGEDKKIIYISNMQTLSIKTNQKSGSIKKC